MNKDMDFLQSLKSRFAIDGAVEFEAGHGNLPKIVLKGAGSIAHLYLHGAHLTHFQPEGTGPVLFTSASSEFQEGKAIRGGVPLIFPWFGPHSDPEMPVHGFARTRPWNVQGTEVLDDGRVRVMLTLEEDGATKDLWPFGFTANFNVTLGEELEMQLVIRNSGDETFEFEEALHTYLRVGDVRKISLTGLEETDYLDKTDEMKRKTEGQSPVCFTGMTDRVYLDTESVCVVDDPVLGRKLIVEKSGSRTTVVWNPWTEKAAALPDFGDDEWPEMVCVESGNANRNAVTLAPGETRAMCAAVRVA